MSQGTVGRPKLMSKREFKHANVVYIVDGAKLAKALHKAIDASEPKPIKWTPEFMSSIGEVKSESDCIDTAKWNTLGEQVKLLMMFSKLLD